ncbi:GlxA family transcriptional regulator [Streptomyces sp. WAC06614]|uniref:GlxA family transcriptional regulator n=1 Tax=Streptomyces sp. WAC06614 TaxID=2487416 RepID=UPI000F7B685C|nr:helix-turn-helix domain-containing protein [Streptomyces sp. WAC06614]RSS79757.1 helix-turn-helix domain-containing protein [Streptomyces sp. WAC06614]
MGERHVVVVGYASAELLDIACVTTGLAMANGLGRPSPPYRVSVAGPGGAPIVCGSGLVLQAQHSLERLVGPLDTLVVSGGLGFEEAAEDARLVGHVRRLARESRRVASVCTGAGILAAAGLLDGLRATTHWRYAAQLAARHPRITVDPAPIFIREGNVYTAAGVTSALDLTLAFIEEDHGAELARQVSRDLVTYLQRPGNQAQMSVFTAAPAPDNDLVRSITEHILAHPDHDLGTAALAARAGVTPRHLTRLFTEHTGQAPGRYVRQARTEAAAQLLTTTDLPVARIATRCGFGTTESLRLAFTSRYGISPSHYRATQTRG